MKFWLLHIKSYTVGSSKPGWLCRSSAGVSRSNGNGGNYRNKNMDDRTHFSSELLTRWFIIDSLSRMFIIIISIYLFLTALSWAGISSLIRFALSSLSCPHVHYNKALGRPKLLRKIFWVLLYKNCNGSYSSHLT
jgi:hypothetical protein